MVAVWVLWVKLENLITFQIFLTRSWMNKNAEALVENDPEVQVQPRRYEVGEFVSLPDEDKWTRAIA